MFDQEYNEKRDYIRLFVDADLAFTVNQQPQSYSGKCKELSGNGLAFETQCELKQGDMLDLVLTAEKDQVKPLELKVKVVRIENNSDDSYFVAAETQS